MSMYGNLRVSRKAALAVLAEQSFGDWSDDQLADWLDERLHAQGRNATIVTRTGSAEDDEELFIATGVML